MNRFIVRSISLCLFLVVASCVSLDTDLQLQSTTQSYNSNKGEKAMHVHYLEVVTPEVDATCNALEKMHAVTFGVPQAALGNARTAEMKNGGILGVRAPMRDTEQPVVRPYMLVQDLAAAVLAAEKAGAMIALPPTELPEHGQIAIYILGGIEHGLWQL